MVPRGCQGRHYDDAAVMLVLIGVIYGSKRGTGTPTFGLRGTVPLTFQDKMVKNLFSTEAGAASQAPLGELMTLSQTPESDEEGYFSSRVSPRDPRALHSPSELVLQLFRPKLRPCSFFLAAMLKH